MRSKPKNKTKIYFNNMDLTTLVGTDINGYVVTKYIASGSFGDVYKAKHSKTDELVALKIPIKTSEKDGERWLIEEADIYNELNKNKSDEGVANVKIISNKQLDKKIMVMDLLGPSLECIKTENKRLTIKNIIILAIKMIELLRYIHDKGYIHRDIKPDNFVMSSDKGNKLYCIDFGLAKKYVKKNGKQYTFNSNNKFCGTARYASIAAHKGERQSRKDDLESVCYLLIYLFRSKLPWMGIKHSDKKKRYNLILAKKESVSEEELCDQLPREFLVFFKSIRSLDFDEKPHYSSLIKMFQKLLSKYKDPRLSWTK
jgi:serine/threonine protein kinase